MNKYIILNVFLSLFIIIFAGCKAGINVDGIEFPKNLVQDASSAYFKADKTRVEEDFASVVADPTKTIDAMLADELSDAERLVQSIIDDGKVFIEEPADSKRKEHLKHVFAATALKIKKLNQAWSLKSFNTAALDSTAKAFGLDDETAKDYFLSVARRLNDSVSEQDAIEISLDPLPATLEPQELFAVLSKPRIVARSEKALSTFSPLFKDKAAKNLKMAGLNPVQVYEITDKFFKRTVPNSIPLASLEPVILGVTKVISVIEPNTSLTSLSKLFEEIAPTLTGFIDTDDYKGKLADEITRFFNVNADFIKRLDLDGRNLSNLNLMAQKNPTKFQETTYGVNRIPENLRQLAETVLTTKINDPNKLAVKTYDFVTPGARASAEVFKDWVDPPAVYRPYTLEKPGRMWLPANILAAKTRNKAQRDAFVDELKADIEEQIKNAPNPDIDFDQGNEVEHDDEGGFEHQD